MAALARATSWARCKGLQLPGWLPSGHSLVCSPCSRVGAALRWPSFNSAMCTTNTHSTEDFIIQLNCIVQYHMMIYIHARWSFSHCVLFDNTCFYNPYFSLSFFRNLIHLQSAMTHVIELRIYIRSDELVHWFCLLLNLNVNCSGESPNILATIWCFNILQSFSYQVYKSAW